VQKGASPGFGGWDRRGHHLCPAGETVAVQAAAPLSPTGKTPCV